MIRSVEPSDIPQILQIYEYYILNSHVTFEEEVPTLMEFTERVNDIHKKYPFLVFVENEKVLGYSYANLFRTRNAYRFTTEVCKCKKISDYTNLFINWKIIFRWLYVDKNHFGKKIGSNLYAKLLSILKEQGYHSAIGCLAVPNDSSIKLHKNFGFKNCGNFEETGYKFNQWYSTEFWQLMLEDYTI